MLVDLTLLSQQQSLHRRPHYDDVWSWRYNDTVFDPTGPLLCPTGAEYLSDYARWIICALAYRPPVVGLLE